MGTSYGRGGIVAGILDEAIEEIHKLLGPNHPLLQPGEVLEECIEKMTETREEMYGLE